MGYEVLYKLNLIRTAESDSYHLPLMLIVEQINNYQRHKLV
ncbi:hypothetical protein yrohd0001_31970 [Yersinia rohdei ATCC 43380]|nr:hypothetical protein yrohd0001_31970 [Yersinia rohdei ATCC 43380]